MNLVYKYHKYGVSRALADVMEESLKRLVFTSLFAAGLVLIAIKLGVHFKNQLQMIAIIFRRIKKIITIDFPLTDSQIIQQHK